MNAILRKSTVPLAAFPTEPVQVGECQRVVTEIIERWRTAQPSDCRQVLAEHPELAVHRSLVLDLIYEEFCRRRELGEVIDQESFCDRFPAYRHSVTRMIEVHEIIEQNPHLNGSETRWPKPGDDFRGFEIVEELGRGTLARAYLACEAALGGRLVVVKLAYAGAYEAATLGKLLHPNIVRIHSVQDDPASGQSLICMAFHGRATLADVLDQVFAEAFPPRRAETLLRCSRAVSHPDELTEKGEPDSFLLSASYANGVVHLATKLAEALAYTHSRGICHRDLKPSNILLTPAGCPMLLDFNLSSDRQAAIPRVGGTLPYMPPEQIESAVLNPSSAPTLDERADLFSLGVLMYQMLSRQLPFGAKRAGASLREMASEIILQQRAGPVPLRQKCHFIDGDVATIVERCLRFSPADRPASAAELAMDLRRCLTTRRRIVRWVKMHRALVAAAAVGLTAICAACGTALALRPPYEIRTYQQALRSIERKQYGSALTSLDRVLGARPDFAQAYVARGDVYRLRGDFAAALLNYESARNIHDSPDASSLAAHCQTWLNRPQLAVASYQRAYRKGSDTPAIHNNLGFNLMRLRNYAEAKVHLDRALQLDNRLQPAYHNRACLDYLIHRNTMGSAPTEGILDVRQAIELGPPSGQLFYDSARLYSLAAQYDPDWIEPAISALKNAIDLGLDFAGLAKQRVFDPLRRHTDFDALSVRPRGPASSFAANLVIDPD